MTKMESELFKGTAKEFMKSYKDGGMVYLESKEKDEIIQDMKDMEFEIERLTKIIEQSKYTADELNEIERLNNIINELERRFNQELENNEKYDIEDTKEFYSKKWVRDTLNDFINMIKELKGEDKEW